MFTQYSADVTFKVRFDEGTAPIKGRYEWQGEIFPATGTIRFYTRSHNGTGGVTYDVTVTGPKVKKDGTPSKTEATYEWSTGIYPEDANVPHVRAMYETFIAAAEAARCIPRTDS